MKKSNLFAMMALGAVLFASSTVGLSSAAHAATFDPNATYKIINQGSGKALDVEFNSIDAWTGLHQWTYLGLTSQQWKLKPSTDGYYYMVNVNSGLAAYASGGDNGSRVQQTFFDNRETEKWDLQQFGSSFKIASKYYGKVFDIKYNTSDDGGKVHLWQSLSGINTQLWNIVQL